MSVASVVANLFDGRLPFRVEAFDGSEVAPTIVSPANEITLRILRPEALIRILRRPAELGLARAFVAGDLELDGDLDALFSLELPSLRYLFSPATFLPLLRLIGPAAVRPLAPPAIEARQRGALHSRERDRDARQVGEHRVADCRRHLAEIGTVLGVTESRVCQIHTKSIFQLRSRLSEPTPERGLVT